MVSPTVILEKRASSTSSSSASSDPCKHSKSASCEKPVSTTGLEIGLGIGIPVAVVFAALGFLMWWRYRKNKKESMEHDPDFDENGDATALPDFPPYARDDPFDNRFSVRPHSRHMDMASHARSADVGSVSTRNNGDDAPVDGFVLPYHHNTSSKASLEEFARQSVDHRMSTLRGSSLRYKSGTPGESNNTSPQKSSLRYEQQESVAEKHAPVGKLSKDDYKNLANHSVASLSANEYFNTKEEISDDTNDTSKSSDHDFTVEYENEDTLPINQSLSANTSPRKPNDHEASSDDFADASDSRGPFLEKNHDEPVDTTNVISDESPEPELEEKEIEEHPESDEEEEPRQVAPAILVRSPFEEQNETFETEEPTQNTTYNASHDDTSEHRSLDPSPNTSLDPKNHERQEPRLSAFDLLKNVSDDEGEDDSKEREELNPEQAEELARMKSVYKVYFDRSNSMRTNASTGGDGTFQADANQPLPKIDIDHLQINDQLKGDTQYDKRKTTTSSIYDEAPIFAEDAVQPQAYPQYNMPHQQYSQHPYAQLPPQQYMPPPPPPEELPPLKSLPSASEIRRSTIETFTDYQPKGKGRLHPIGEGSQGSSPYLTQSNSFSTLKSPTSEMPPSSREEGGSTPTPHQLSRTSVSIMNPVDEFRSQRFRPAGSLPRQPTQPSHMNEYSQSNDDLIPGNRKSAVRRMMNTNF